MTPSPASATRLLIDLVCDPVAMRGDRHAALVRDLASGAYAARKLPVQPKSDIPPGDDGDDEDDDELIMPWDKPLYTVENGIAVLTVNGPLVKGYDVVTCWWYDLASIDRLQAAVAEIATRGDVLAMVLVVNSPGGVCTGMDELCAQICGLSDAGIQTIGFTSDCACSNGYRLLCCCDEVCTTLSASLGCIGTYIALYDYSVQLAAMGIKLELFKRGTYKAIGVTGSSLSKEQRAFLDESVGRANDRFLQCVRDCRGEVADSTMQGQWFDGDQAVALNLADRVVPSLQSVLAETAGGVQSALGSFFA